ncbi:MAG: tectonin domain-containing protein, partial [Thalassolituus sp.]
SRIELAATSPSKATAAEKELLKSYAEAVVHFRTYLADQSLQAYRAWDVADRKKNEVYSTVMIAGIGVAATATTFGTTAALYGMGAEAIRNELWPVPDFSELTLQSVIEDQLKGEAIGFVYTKVLLSDAVLKKFFPKSADLRAIRKTMTEAVEKAQTTMAKYALQKVSTEAATKAASAGAKVTSQAVLKAISAAGPQILADLAIETVIAWIELQIERANAEPRLNAMLADAKRPFDVKRLLATTSGVAEVEGQWTTVIAATTSPTDKAALKAAVAEAMKASANKGNVQIVANFKALKWKSLGHKADAIFMGHDGDLYRRTSGNKGDAIEAFDAKNRSKPWSELASGYSQVVAGAPKQLFLLNNDTSLATVNTDGKSLRKIDGHASQIAAAGEKDLWVVSERLTDNESDIWMSSGSRWAKLPGFSAKYLAEADGYLWAVKANGDIYRSDTNESEKIASAKMRRIDGKANGIASGDDGAVVVVGTNKKLYGWNDIDKNWQAIEPPAAPAQVVLKDSGTMYMLSESGEIYQGTTR